MTWEFGNIDFHSYSLLSVHVLDLLELLLLCGCWIEEMEFTCSLVIRYLLLDLECCKREPHMYGLLYRSWPFLGERGCNIFLKEDSYLSNYQLAKFFLEMLCLITIILLCWGKDKSIQDSEFPIMQVYPYTVVSVFYLSPWNNNCRTLDTNKKKFYTKIPSSNNSKCYIF